MIKLSIITINYNNGIGLKKTIESVINQTYKDFEYIVIDGASTDDSFEIINQYIKNITYWVSEQDKGIYNAMNKGILASNGEYLLFLNSGDYLIDNKILQQVSNYIEMHDIVYGDGYVENSSLKRTLISIPEIIKLNYLHKTSLFHPSTFIKKELFNLYGLYNEENKIVSDWEFFLNTILIKKASYKKISFVISIVEEGGVSRNSLYSELLQDEIKNTLAKYFTEQELILAKSEAHIQTPGVYNKKDLFTRFFTFIKIKK